MPSCEPCGTFYNPNSLSEEGTCPSCGEPVVRGDLAQHQLDDHELERAVPWHFWVGVAAVTAYLGWRVIQGLLALF
jgi:hypothetical protein